MPIPAMQTQPQDLALPALGILLAGLLIGWLLLFLCKRQDRKTWIFARAPALPVRSLSEHDDAWIRGAVRCDRPLYCPWFDTPCVHYEYQVERKVTTTYRDSKGRTRTRTSWRTEHSESDTTAFRLDDGDPIHVRGTEASYEGLQSTGYDYEWGSRRHSARLLPVDETVSVLGVKLEDDSFGPLREVPLLVTPMTRDERIRASDSAERWLRRFGYGFLFLGAAGAVFFLCLRGMRWEPAASVALACLAGLLALLPFWLWSTYNLYVRLRNQLQASWRQIDVDLGVRAGLVPQLVAVIEGYRVHERTLVERLARIRAEGRREQMVRQEGEAVAATRQLLALREKYPELRADELFLDLHDRLWALEEKLAVSRGLYNGIAKEWNDLVQGFPSSLAASLFGHGPRDFFAAETVARPAPTVAGAGIPPERT